MKKRNLKKGVAIELALLVLIIVTFASALILSLAVISTKQKNNENALFNHKVHVEEIAEDIIWKRYGDTTSPTKYERGNKTYYLEIEDSVNNYVLKIVEDEGKITEKIVKCDVKFARIKGVNDNYTLKIIKQGSDSALLTVELKVQGSGKTAKITIISWQY